MTEALSEESPLQSLDLESSQNNDCSGADCFDNIPDLKMEKRRKELCSVLMLERVRPSRTATKGRSTTVHEKKFLGHDTEEYAIENASLSETCSSSSGPAEELSPTLNTYTSSSSESFDGNNQSSNFDAQNGLELWFQDEFFGDKSNHPNCTTTPSIWANGGVSSDDDEEEADHMPTKKKLDCLAYIPTAVLPKACLYHQCSSGVGNAESPAVSSFSCSSCKVRSSTGVLHRSSDLEETIPIKELSPRMQQKLANLKSFRSNSFGGILGKQLRNCTMKKDRDGQSSSFRVIEDTGPTVGSNSLPLARVLSQQHIKSNYRSGDRSEPSDSTTFQKRRLNRCSTFNYGKTVSWTNRDAQEVQRLAVEKFNINPDDCIKYLVSQGILRKNCPEDVCNFILSEPGLSKRKLGEMYAKGTPFEKEVFEFFLQSLNLQDMTLDNALRCMVRKFRMPGEAQQIDRILGMFAKRFMEENKGTFSCTDTAYILSFSLLMLNTDLHNRSIKGNQRMTLEQFINNNRGIDQQNDLPRELLEGYYQRVQAEEVRMDEGDTYESEVLTFIAPKRSGWLKKKKDEAPRCIIPLKKCHVSKYLSKKDFSISSHDVKQHVVKSVKIREDGSMVQGNHKDFILRADTETERDQWVKCIEEEILAQDEKANDIPLMQRGSSFYIQSITEPTGFVSFIFDGSQ